MRVLFLVTRFPHPPHRGDQVRAYHHLVHLARRHEITLCVIGRMPSAVDLAAVTRLGVSVELIPNEPIVAGLRMLRGLWDRRPIQALWVGSSGARSRVRALAADADVVHAQLVRTGLLIDGLGVPVVLDLVDALSMNLGRRSDHDRGPRRWASAIEARRLGTFERSLAGRVAGVAVSTADDASAIGEPAVEVVPNGVDLATFPFHSHPRPDPVVVFAGNLGYFPNVDAARTLARDIMPGIRHRMPAARLVLAGARPSRTVRRLQGTGVELITEPDDLAPVVGAAAVAVVPMRAGTGIQNKVLEAMAVGTPVVTTARVAAAVGAVHGEHLLIADGVDEFAAAAASLMTDPRGAAGVAANARRFVEERYRWEASAAAIERLWRSAVGGEQ
ncbi:MAG: glycosyltransferase [Actinomycetota bacterium]